MSAQARCGWQNTGGWVIRWDVRLLRGTPPGVGDLGLGQVKEPAAAQAEAERPVPLIRSLIIWAVSEVKQPRQAPSSQAARASAPYRATIRR